MYVLTQHTCLTIDLVVWNMKHMNWKRKKCKFGAFGCSKFDFESVCTSGMWKKKW
jgi:hypothetical protein